MTLEELILAHVNTHTIADQKTLLTIMAKEGFDIDQPTLSRLFKKLHIQKHLGKYVVKSASKGFFVPRDYRITCVPPNLMVIKTRPGYANALSALLEENPPAGVEGTIAGDDTIFLAVSATRALVLVQQDIEKALAEL